MKDRFQVTVLRNEFRVFDAEKKKRGGPPKNGTVC
jgi:hypothetical protein